MVYHPPSDAPDDKPDMASDTQPHGIRFADILWKDRPVRLEYRWVGVPASRCPVVVFLHEGLGSVAAWRDFPDWFCRQHGFSGLLYSRPGYGRSTPRLPDENLPPTYLHEQAHDVLPALLRSLRIERPWLFGHSDGASIALLHAARFPDGVSGIVVAAPHIFVEDLTLDGIRKAREMFLTTDLPTRLARYHADADRAFRDWNDAWLSPAFRGWNIEDRLSAITCPVLGVQGEQDDFGTLEQIAGIRKKAPHTQLLPLADCGHVPHRDQPALLSERAGAFIKAHSAV